METGPYWWSLRVNWHLRTHFMEFQFCPWRAAISQKHEGGTCTLSWYWPRFKNPGFCRYRGERKMASRLIQGLTSLNSSLLHGNKPARDLKDLGTATMVTCCWSHNIYGVVQNQLWISKRSVSPSQSCLFVALFMASLVLDFVWIIGKLLNLVNWFIFGSVLWHTLLPKVQLVH